MGSKTRYAKEIIKAIKQNCNFSEYEFWVEPFVGGANMIDKIVGNRIGNDSHEFLIALLVALRDGYVPPTYISKELYHAVKSKPQEYSKELVGFVGFLCSFGGKWWGGYASNKKEDNYAERGSRCLVKQAKNLDGIVFKSGSYLELEIPENSLIYCDPPYANTCRYKDDFNHDIFWDWCRTQTKSGHTVFISEYHAPNDFVCVKEIQHKTILDKNSQYPRIEKLFRYKA